MELKLRTIGQSLFLEKEADIIASDTRKFLTATFETDEIWDGYVLTALVCLDPRNITEETAWGMMMGDDKTVTVPLKPLKERGKFYMGLYGVKDDERITSTMLEFTKKKGAWIDTEHTPEEALPLYEHMLDIVTFLQNDNLSIHEQLKLKQVLLKAGSNISIYPNPDGTETIAAYDIELFIIVTELPKIGIENKIYLVPQPDGSFVEWIWIDGKWVDLGSMIIDLSNYYNKNEVDALLASKAPVNSPNFTGIPTAPTALVDTSTNQIATTEFVSRLVKPSFLRGDGNTITIFVAPIGSTTGFGRTRNEPVTFQRAVEVAHMCDGTGTIKLLLINGTISNVFQTGGYVRFDSLVRSLAIECEGAIEHNNLSGNTNFDFLCCTYVSLSGINMVRNVAITGNPAFIRFHATIFNFSNSRIYMDVSKRQADGVFIVQSDGNIENVQITETNRAVNVSQASTVSARNLTFLTGGGNARGYLSSSSIIMRSGTTTHGGDAKEHGGQIFT